MCARYTDEAGQDFVPSTEVRIVRKTAFPPPAPPTWTSFAKRERLRWWIRQPGMELVGLPASRIAERADDTRELIWQDLPPGSLLCALMEPRVEGKSGPYCPVRVVTRAATAAEVAFFRHGRFPVVVRAVEELDQLES